MAKSRRVAVTEMGGDDSQILVRICKDRTDTTKYLKDFFENDENRNSNNDISGSDLRKDIDMCYQRGGTLRENTSYSVAKVLCENGAGGTMVRMILDGGLGLSVPTRFFDEKLDNVTKKELSNSFNLDIQLVDKVQVVSHVELGTRAHKVGFLPGDILLQRPEKPASSKTELQLFHPGCDNQWRGHVGRWLYWKGLIATKQVMAFSPAASVATDGGLSSFGSPWTPATPKSTNTARSRQLPLSSSKKASATKPTALFGSPKPLLSGPGTSSFASGAPTTTAPAPAPSPAFSYSHASGATTTTTAPSPAFSFRAPVPAPASGQYSFGTQDFSFGAPKPAPAPVDPFEGLGAASRLGTSLPGSLFGYAAPAPASAFDGSATFEGLGTAGRFGTSLGSFGSSTLSGDPSTALLSREEQKTPRASSLAKASSSRKKSVSFAPRNNNQGDAPRPDSKFLSKATAKVDNSDLLSSLRLNEKTPPPFSLGTSRPMNTSSSFGAVLLTGTSSGPTALEESRSSTIRSSTRYGLFSSSSQGRRGAEEDSDDEEIDEERENAKKAFLSLSIRENGHDVVAFSQLEILFYALGSTYCDEEYGDDLRKLEKQPGKLRLNDFLSWYIHWIFEDDGSDGGEEQEEKPSAVSAGPVHNLWGNTFKKPQGSWKCEMCLSQVNREHKKCLACDAPRPVYLGDASYPPMSAKAPTPFSQQLRQFTTETAPSTSSSSSAFPPMATKAPTPFGASSGAKPAASSSSSVFAPFPPMATKAPTPFGSSA